MVDAYRNVSNKIITEPFSPLHSACMTYTQCCCFFYNNIFLISFKFIAKNCVSFYYTFDIYKQTYVVLDVFVIFIFVYLPLNVDLLYFHKRTKKNHLLSYFIYFYNYLLIYCKHFSFPTKNPLPLFCQKNRCSLTLMLCIINTHKRK